MFPVAKNLKRNKQLLLFVTVNKCKDDWAKLRNAFASALKRRRNKKSGQAAAALVPWKYEENMSLLLPYMECRSTKTNVTTTPESPPTEESPDESLPESPSTSRSQSQSSSSRGKPNKEPKLQELYDLMKSSQDLRRQKQNFRQDMDETDLFFLSMSKELKALPKLEQTKIKLDLHTAISQALIRQLEHRDKILKTPIKITTQRFIQSTPQHQSSTYIQTTANAELPTYNQSPSHDQSPTYIELSIPTTSRAQNHADSSTYIQTTADVHQSPIHAQSPTYIQSSSFPSGSHSKPVVSDNLKAYYDSINFEDEYIQNNGLN